MPTILRARLRRLTVPAVVLATAGLVSLGTGYKASQAVLDPASAYLAKGRTLVHVNGETGGPDARLARELAESSPQKQRLATVELPNGRVYAVNRDTGEVWRVDTSRMDTDLVHLPPRDNKKPDVELASGGQDVYAVNHRDGILTWIDPATNQGTDAVRLPNGIGEVVVDSHGTAWVRSGGEVLEIDRTVQKNRISVADGDGAHLTLVGDRPIVLRDNRQVLRVGPHDAEPVATITVPENTSVKLAVPSDNGDVLWAVLGTSGQLARVDLASGQSTVVQVHRLSRHSLGNPVVWRDHVYLPDYTDRAVRVLDAAGMQQKSVHVPTQRKLSGRSEPFEVFTRGGRVWANDQWSKQAVAIDGNGVDHRVDKGNGDGVGGPAPTTGPHPRPDTPSGPQQPAPETELPTRQPQAPLPTNPSGANTPPPTQPAPPTANPPGAPSAPSVPTVTVPNVVGQDRAAVCPILKATKLGCTPVPIGNDGKGPTGEVLDTAPKRGESVPVNTDVTVFYRDDITLPDFSGKRVADACLAVQTAGLNCVQNPTGCATSAQRVNVVATQNPPPGTQMKTGDPVTVTFPEQVEVPNLVGSAVGDAVASLTAIGLTSTQTDLGTAPPGSMPGAVVNQNPQAPQCIPPTQPVILSSYGTVSVPNVMGMSPVDAQNTIQQAGLIPVPVSDWPTNQPNVVQNQSPAANTPAAPGSQVTYYYEDAIPTPLYLHKRSGDPYYQLSTAANIPGYSNQRSLGYVFTTPAGGTTPVYTYQCDAACGPGTTFYYSMSNVASISPGWRNIGVVAFYAYAQPPPAGTAEVKAMYSTTDRSWVWARTDSPEYGIYVSRGFTSTYNFALGWV